MRQRSPRNDPTLLDGDSAHGNPGEPAGDERAVDSDTDIGSLSTADESGLDEFEAPVDRGEPEGERSGVVVADRGPPIRGYQRLTVPEVVRRATKLGPAELAELLNFERSHRNRKTLIARLSRLAGRQ